MDHLDEMRANLTANRVGITNLFDYQNDLVDTVDGGPVTDKTSLVALHQPKPKSLVDNLSRIAYPEKRCHLVIDDKLFPPLEFAEKLPHKKYICTVTFCDLFTAPRIRIKFTWPGYGRLAVAIKVRISDKNLRLVSNGTTDELTVIPVTDFCTLTRNPISTEGFNRATKRASAIGTDCQRLLETLRSLLQPQTRATADDPVFVAAPPPIFLGASTPEASLRIRFCDTLASEPKSTASCLPEILPFVLGPDKLPSLSRADYSQLFPLSMDKFPLKLMASKAPWPMTPLSSGNTYNSIADVQAQLFETARVSHDEARLGLEQSANVKHKVTPFHLGQLVIMAVTFKLYTPLKGPNGVEVPFRLPEGMTTKIDSDQVGIECAARLCAPMPLLEGFDALFSISHPSKELRAIAHDIHDQDLRTPIMMSFQPSVSDFTLRSQLSTATALSANDVARWVPTILNQSPSLSPVDLATTCAKDVENEINEDKIQEASRMMMGWRDWNPEQIAALKSVRSAVGSIVLITGPAGTGKTLVQQIIAAFFFLIGFHVLVVAPANSNVADFVAKLHKNFPDGSVQALRILPSSAEKNMRDLSNSSQSQVAQTEGAPVPDTHLFEIEMVRAQISAASEKYDSGRESSLQHQVLATAKSKTLQGTLIALLYSGNRKEMVDMWKKFQEFIEQADRDEFEWDNAHEVDHFDQCYQNCKGHFVARHRLLVTTTGNVYSSDIQDHWAQDLHGVSCKGVMVIVDEACKDNEIDTLGPLMCRGFREKVIGMAMVGDNKQLTPTDISAKGQVVFSPFPDRKSIPLLSRLKDEGHPCVELHEQHRMHASIADWPFENFYPARMRSSKSAYRLLSDTLPGLQQCLAKALGHDSACVPGINAENKDAYLRTHYIEVNGTRVKHNLSSVVREHIVEFFNDVFPFLQAYYRENMRDNVTIIVAYKEARYCWQQACKQMQKECSLKMSQLPKVITIDSSQGTEAPFTIIDCSVQKFMRDSDIGFVDDDSRINVAMTRAQEVRWFLGGSCSSRHRRRQRNTKPVPSYVRYRDHTSDTDTLTALGNELLPNNGNGWLNRLQKPTKVLERTFADDKAGATGHRGVGGSRVVKR